MTITKYCIRRTNNKENNLENKIQEINFQYTTGMKKNSLILHYQLCQE